MITIKAVTTQASPFMSTTVVITSRGGGVWHVQLPDGNHGCQPSKDFALSMVRRWAAEREVKPKIQWK